jgi:hypothetical protein
MKVKIKTNSQGEAQTVLHTLAVVDLNAAKVAGNKYSGVFVAGIINKGGKSVDVASIRFTADELKDMIG